MTYNGHDAHSYPSGDVLKYRLGKAKFHSFKILIYYGARYYILIPMKHITWYKYIFPMRY